MDQRVTIESGSAFEKFEGGTQRIWDASSLGTYGRCPRLYKLAVLDRWCLKREGEATLWGKAVHRGVEVLDTFKFQRKGKQEAQEEAVRTVLREYGENLQRSNDTARSLETALRAVVWKAEEHFEDSWRVAEMPDGKPALEVRFEVPFPTGHRFSGRLDKIVWIGDDLYIVDTKTTKASLSDFYFSRYNPDSQFYAYIWALREVMGLPIKGFIIDGVQTMVSATRFGRAVFNVEKAQIDEWLDATSHQLKQADYAHESQTYHPNFGGCSSYGGCRFLKLCTVGPAHRQAFLEEEFEVVPYKPEPMVGEDE